MARMTRKQVAQKRRDDWRQAVSDGRVVRYGGGISFTAFQTVELAQQAVECASRNGFPAEIVIPMTWEKF